MPGVDFFSTVLTFLSLVVVLLPLWTLQQHHRLSSLCILHGRHREGFQWKIQRAEEQWVSVDTCSRGASPKTKVRDVSLTSKLSLSTDMFFCLWQRSFCRCCYYCSALTTADTCFPSCSSPKTNSCHFFYICAHVAEFSPDGFSSFLCCCSGPVLVPVKGQRPPTSHPPPFLTRLWLSSSLTR